MITTIKAKTPQARAAVEFGCLIYGIDVEQTGPLTATLFYQDADKAAQVLHKYPADIVKVTY